MMCVNHVNGSSEHVFEYIGETSFADDVTKMVAVSAARSGVLVMNFQRHRGVVVNIDLLHRLLTIYR